MSGSEHSAEDRTEAPTQKRLDQAREAGQLPVSRDLTTLAGLAGGVFGGLMLGPDLCRQVANQAAVMLGASGRMHLSDTSLFGGHLSKLAMLAVMTAACIALPASLCTIGCTLLQTRFYVGGAPLRFQLERISPAAGLERLFSQKHLLDFLKSLGRLAILAWLVWSVLGSAPAAALAVVDTGVAGLLPAARLLIESLARPLLIALAAFAAIDVLLVRFQHAKSMRMTREQVRLEMRDTDGDPLIKAKLKRIREQRSRRRMMEKVKSAAVVVTNPTHYAVALSYDRTGAPRVVAKGMDFVAARIREEAQAHAVPLVANPPLARALYQVELDHEIPAEHYKAVAEVIAFVWRLRARRPQAGL